MDLVTKVYADTSSFPESEKFDDFFDSSREIERMMSSFISKI